jgi:hypothetical protein
MANEEHLAILNVEISERIHSEKHWVRMLPICGSYGQMHYQDKIIVIHYTQVREPIKKHIIQIATDENSVNSSAHPR